MFNFLDNRKNMICLISILTSIFIVYICLGIINYTIKANDKPKINNISIIGKNPIDSSKKNIRPTIYLNSIIGKQPIVSSKSNIQKIEKEVQSEKNEGKMEILNIVEKCSDSIEKKAVALEENKKCLDNTEKKEVIQTEYEGFETIGLIEIPATGVNTPILSNVTVKGMEKAPCLLYKTGELNDVGNSLIIGHNFRNGTLFSNNNNLNINDKIYITSLNGIKKEYIIYDKFISTAEDVSFIKRDTNNKSEITLSCCTDDDLNRIIILAREK